MLSIDPRHAYGSGKPESRYETKKMGAGAFETATPKSREELTVACIIGARISQGVDNSPFFVAIPHRHFVQEHSASGRASLTNRARDNAVRIRMRPACLEGIPFGLCFGATDPAVPSMITVETSRYGITSVFV